jgi:hypothetical protein
VIVSQASPGRPPGRVHPETADGVDQRARKAIKDLRRQNTPLTISAVVARAGLTRAALYRRAELLAEGQVNIRQTLLDDRSEHA